MSDSLHRELLAGLFENCIRPVDAPARNIRLVSRLRDDMRLSRFDDDKIILFVPDLHILSREFEKKFRYGFNKSAPNSPVARQPLFEAMMTAILQFESDNSGKVLLYQLGDYVDLWREGQFQSSAAIAAARIFNDNTFLNKYLGGLSQAGSWMSYVPGNHDLDLTTTPGFGGAKRAYAPGMQGRNPLLVTHGDLFDKTECQMNDATQAYFVERFGPNVDANVYDLKIDKNAVEGGYEYPRILVNETFDTVPTRIHVAYGEQRVSVRGARALHELLASAVSSSQEDERAEVRGDYGAIKAVADLKSGFPASTPDIIYDATGVPAFPDLQVVVVGHSHFPRIVIIGKPGDPKGFVLMDCGAWIESVKWPAKSGAGQVLDSCQLGVISGSDARIYQLDPA